MSDFSCQDVRALLPDWASRGLPSGQSVAVEVHLAACGECAAEAELLRALRRNRPGPPDGLAVRIQDALRLTLESSETTPRPPMGGSRRGGSAPGWAPFQRPGLAAAAIAVLALGTAVLWPRVQSQQSLPGLRTEPDTPLMGETWTDDAGIVAGAPVLEELSDEQLLILLEELEG